MSIDSKNPFKFLAKLVIKLFLADIFQLHKYRVLAFIIVPITRKKQQGGGKFRIWKFLIVKWRSFQFSMKCEKNLPSLHVKEISPSIFSPSII